MGFIAGNVGWKSVQGRGRLWYVGVTLFLMMWLWLPRYVYMGRFMWILKICKLVSVYIILQNKSKIALIQENLGIELEVLYYASTVPSPLGYSEKNLLHV